MPEKEKLIEMYQQMLRIRHFEEKVYELYGQNLAEVFVPIYAKTTI